MTRQLITVFSITLLAVTQYLLSAPASAENSRQSRKSKVFAELRPITGRPFASGISPKVSTLAPARPLAGRTSAKKGRAERRARSVKNRMPFRKQVGGVAPDPVKAPAVFSSTRMPGPTISFDGISSNDNAAAYGFRIFPPDTIGDVGPRNYVQAVNSLFRVFDKRGNALTPPLKMSGLFSSLETPCSKRDDGDPIVLYDPLSDRWLLSQFCKKAPPFRQMIAVSESGDPTGRFFVYEFVMPNVKLNDYPKFAVWQDAFYMSTDEFFGSDYAGSGVFAFDREKMLAGDPSAGFIYFDLASPGTIRLGGLLPVDLDGLAKLKAGSPGLFVGYTATEYGDPDDALRIFEFTADFDAPANSTFAERPESPLIVPSFDPTSENGRNDIKQPPPGEGLDSQSDRLMFRASLRRLSSGDVLVVNQTVRVSVPGETYRAGVRVHELTRIPGSVFTVRTSSTIGGPGASRFMGAAATDNRGNLAVGYSTSSIFKPPRIVYSGRARDDPPGVFRTESGLADGTGVQTAFGFRWGDYSGLSVDPSDGCTFWITNQYYTIESQNESAFGWLTRIGAFKFDECSPVRLPSVSGVITDASTSLPIPNAVFRIDPGFFRTTEQNGIYGPVLVPRGVYTASVEATGFVPAKAVIDLSAGLPVVKDFALEPAAVIERSSFVFTKESCSLNGAAEVGETVTLEIALRNTGAAATTRLVAALEESGGVTRASAEQDFGAMAPGDPPVKRRFTFTVDGSVPCGSPLTVKLKLTDGNKKLGNLVTVLAAGTRKVILREDFDAVKAPRLPDGWSTRSKGAQTDWTSSDERAGTRPNAAFSPDPRQVGLNELVSPEIRITTTDAELSFRNWYDLETTFLRNRLFDGSVLEINIGDTGWRDIVEAGGEFVSGGYDDGVIDSCCQNPLAGRRAWSGKSGVNDEPEFVDSRVKLPRQAAGKNVQLRWRVGTDIGTFRTGQFIDDVEIVDGYECSCRTGSAVNAPFDFDGDGRSDAALFRAADDPDVPDFVIMNSKSGNDTHSFWGSAGDLQASADYDGDQRADLAVFRPSDGSWFILNSSDGLFVPVVFGSPGDVPVPADFDGDGRADLALFNPVEGIWRIIESSTEVTVSHNLGIAGDVPVPDDYDGDGRSDPAVFRPATGTWHRIDSTDGSFQVDSFGIAGDQPVPGDFDGDGRADLAVFRPARGTWHIRKRTGRSRVVSFGLGSDYPLRVDLDGDGRRDIAVYRPGSASWHFIKSSDGGASAFGFGEPGYLPLPSVRSH